jgi:type II secretory pathway pseudopilin PulG
MDQAAIAPYYQGLEGIYAPQRANIQQQQEQLNTESSAALSGLEQARVNAFRDISSKARGMGVAFGGYSPSEQARYTGATYLPAVGNLKSKQLSGLSSLQQALNSIYGNQQTQAMGLYSDAQAKAEQRRQWEAEQAAAAARFQAEQAANERQFQRQMQADAANRAAAPVDPYKGFTTKSNGDNGTNFFGPGNQPITAYQYYSATGGGTAALQRFLQNDTGGGQAAYKDMMSGKMTGDALVKKYPWIFGG